MAIFFLVGKLDAGYKIEVKVEGGLKGSKGNDTSLLLLLPFIPKTENCDIWKVAYCTASALASLRPPVQNFPGGWAYGIINDCGLDVKNWDYQMAKDFFICAKKLAGYCFDCLCTLTVITGGLGGPIPCCNGECGHY